MSSNLVRYRINIGGQITGFAQVTKLYVLRDSNTKALNKSRKCEPEPYLPLANINPCIVDVSDSIQNLILQYSSINTFFKHYLDRNINVDIQNIYRGLAPQRDLIRFLYLISRSINPRRPRKLNTTQNGLVNRLLCILKLERRKTKLSRGLGDPKAEEKYQKAIRRLRSKKQRQRRLLLLELVDRFKKAQLVINSERQLSRKVIDEDTRDVLERSDQLTPEHLLLIDAILTLPETSFENESRRRIIVINTITAYYGVKEGSAPRRIQRGRLEKDNSPPVIKAKEPNTLTKAIRSINAEKRPIIYFVCLRNPSLILRERVASYSTSGSLSRHFIRKYIRRL